MAQPVRLLDQVRDQIRLLHYSYRSEQQYVGWIRRFILFHERRHPREMGGPEVEAFLTHLAVERNVAASTQSQALEAKPARVARCRSGQETGTRAEVVPTWCRRCVFTWNKYAGDMKLRFEKGSAAPSH